MADSATKSALELACVKVGVPYTFYLFKTTY